VLPFVNMSGDKEQEYFSEGLTEELLNSLSRISELQVAARTSSFSFQGEHPDIGTVAHKLNVAAVLEGSVRRSAHTIRITTQLVNGSTGFHVWSQTYDRDLGDVLQLQTEIATAVAEALKVTLLGDIAPKIEIGGTRNPAAFDAYLRASKLYWGWHSAKDLQAAIDTYSEAIRLDPNYALALAWRSIAHAGVANTWAKTEADIRANLDNAMSDAQKAIALAPSLDEGHLALASAYLRALDFANSGREYERALTLGPGNARIVKNSGFFAVRMGRNDAGLAALHRAVALDPLNPNPRSQLADALRSAGRYDEAIAAFKGAQAVDQNEDHYGMNAEIGITHYLLGELQAAQSFCEKPTVEAENISMLCLALVYHKLGRHRDAENQLRRLRIADGDGGFLEYADIYAQWGDRAKALESLDTAMRLRDPNLMEMKSDRLLDPIRQEPRFKAIVQALKFPD
jgi:TolB-like protein/Tfp pilus assembly protein PilF